MFASEGCRTTEN